jgi:hypothetical protein
LSLDTFLGGGDYDYSTTAFDPVGDGYFSARLAYDSPSLTVGANALIDGVALEEGWSADLRAQLWGNRELLAEYATMTNSIYGPDFENDPSALLVSADLWNEPDLQVRGFFSDTDAGYNSFFSTVHPYYETYGSADTGVYWVPWGRWLDNPVVLPNTEILGANLAYQTSGLNLEGVYYQLESNYDSSDPSYAWRNTNWGFYRDLPPDEVAYDQLYALRLGKEIAPEVFFRLTYARQIFNEASGLTYPDPFEGEPHPLEDVDLLMAGVELGF